MDVVGDFLLTLLHGVTNTHLLHWNTKSYSEHKALGEFYIALQDLADAVAEAVIGKYDLTPKFPQTYYHPADNGMDELQGLKDYVAQTRTLLPQDSELQNLIDEIADQIDSTIFMLRLK
jgi:DNA-binding ferritin-like protein